MGIKERRYGEKAEMRKKIMDATIEIINQDGYENLSIRKIAAKIEYSPTTIYLYYKDKAQIITDMSNELYKKIESNTVAIMNENISVSLDKLVHDILLEFIKSLSKEPEMTKAIIYSRLNVIFANDNNNPTPNNKGISMLDQLLAEGIEQKVFKPNTKNASWMIISALLGFVISVVENQLYLHESFNQLAENFVDLLIGGIKH